MHCQACNARQGELCRTAPNKESFLVLLVVFGGVYLCQLCYLCLILEKLHKNTAKQRRRNTASRRRS